MNRERAGMRRSHLPWLRFVYTLLFIGLIAAGLYCGYLAYRTVRGFAATTLFKSIPIIFPAPSTGSRKGQEPAAEPHPEQLPPDQKDALPSQKSIIYPDVANKERVNILLLGIDQRPGESVQCRTDTMILASINPQDMSVSLLSIPRDLWVPIRHPKHDRDRINTAHYWGEIEDYPGGGPELAKDTVEYNFGVPVHYYVRINFDGFKRIIDTIGGIDIDVPATIDDPQYPDGRGGVEHLHIDAGHQHFDGETALKYARTRQGTGDGDFTRMQRQQQVILAVRDRVLGLENLPHLVGQLPQLYLDLGDSVDTDIPFDAMFTLADWTRQIKTEDIRRDSIDRRVASDMMLPDGRAVLIYDRVRARPMIESLFGDPAPEATGTSQVEKLEVEGARVAVYDGMGITGLATQVSSFLQLQGIDVVEVEKADHLEYRHTVVKVYGDKPFTVSWLLRWLTDIGLPEPTIESKGSEGDDVDIVIIVGKDFPMDTIR